MDQPETPSFARSTGVLQAAVCAVAFVIVALIFGHLNQGGLAENGDQLTFIAAVALAALVIVLRLQRAAQTIELDLFLHTLKGRFDYQDAEMRAIEHGLGSQGYLTGLIRSEMSRPVINNYSTGAPVLNSTTSSSGAAVLVTNDPGQRGRTVPGGEPLVVAPAPAKAAAKRAPAKAAAPAKKTAGRVNPSRRAADGKA